MAVAVKTRVGTVDFTPTWKAVLPIIVTALTEGTDEGKRLAKLELGRMADLADAYVAANTKRKA